MSRIALQGTAYLIPCDGVMVTSVPLNEDVELVERNKARLKRRLQERWTCKQSSHTHCYTNLGGAHVPLTEEDIETWVDDLHDGEATMYIPPKAIDPSSKHPDQSDNDSTKSTSSRSTIQYQRHFRLRGNTSLADLRSIKRRLRDSVISTTSTASTASSGVPGIGYLSGKGIKWVGIQMLNVIVPLEMRRRRQVIRKFIKRMAELPVEKRAIWLIRRARKVTYILEDLLEFSSEYYGEEERKKAIEQGVLIKGLIEASVRGRDWTTTVSLMSISVRVFPLFLLADESSTSGGFADDLRETLLQESSELAEEAPLAAEIALQLCFELTYGAQSSWRWQGYAHLCYLYGAPLVKQRFQNLARQGMLIEDFMRRVFDKAILSDTEHAYALIFSARLADDVPALRIRLSAPTGIRLLVENIKGKISHAGSPPYLVWTLCQIMDHLAFLPWCVPILVHFNVCPTLVDLLIINQRDTGPDKAHTKAWAAFCIVRILHNLAVNGGDSERQKVLEAVTDELRQILPNVPSSIRRPLGDEAAEATQTWVQSIREQLYWHTKRTSIP